jgi:hypothetical protein
MTFEVFKLDQEVHLGERWGPFFSLAYGWTHILMCLIYKGERLWGSVLRGL